MMIAVTTVATTSRTMTTITTTTIAAVIAVLSLVVGSDSVQIENISNRTYVMCIMF